MTGYLHRQGISVIPYLEDWLVHHPDRKVLLRHQAQLINRLDLVGSVLNRKKSELDLTQDLQFLRIRLHLDLGEASLPESKAWEIVAPARHLSSLRVLTYTQVFQLMGSLNLGLRSYPSGSFVPETPSTSFSLVRSDRPVYATASIRNFGPCQPSSALAGPTFSYLRNPYPHVSGGIHDFYGRLHAGVGRTHGGFPYFGYLDPYRPQSPHQLFGAQGGNSCPTALGSSAPGPPGALVLRLTVELLLWLEAQNIIVRARNIPGSLNVIADHLSRPNQPISTEWSLHPEIVRLIFRVWGTPEVDRFATVLNSHLPQFMSPIPEPKALVVDALSPDWQGRSLYMFPHSPCSAKSFRNSGPPRRQR